MSERAISFVESWVSEHISADGYAPEGGNSRGIAFAAECVRAAEAQGIPKVEIDEAFESLADYLGGELEEANDREVQRLAAKDD